MREQLGTSGFISLINQITTRVHYLKYAKSRFSDVILDIMGRTAQVIVIIVRTTLLVAYKMENVIIMGVLALDTSLRFVKNVKLDIMVKTAPRNVTIVKTTPPVPYKVRNVMPLAVLTLVISRLHVKVVFLGCTAFIVRRTVADIVGSLTVTEKRAPVSTDVKMDISGVSVTKLVLLVNTDQTAEKYVDIVTTTQSVTMVMGHVWRDVKPVIGTIIVKHSAATADMDRIVSTHAAETV